MKVSRRTYRRMWVAVGVLAVAVIVLALLLGGGGGTTWSAKVVSTQVNNPADLGVAIRVTNTGHSAGTPQCTVNAQDPSGAYTGVNEGTLGGSIQPGRSATAVMQVTVTHQGARYATQVSVSCS